MENSHVYIPPASEIPNRIWKEARRDQIAARECYMAMPEMDDHLQVLNIEERRVIVELIEDLEEISLDDNFPGRITCIGMQVDPIVRKRHGALAQYEPVLLSRLVEEESFCSGKRQGHSGRSLQAARS